MKYELLSKLYYKDKNLYEQTYVSRINSESCFKFDFKLKNNTAFLIFNKEIVDLIAQIHQTSFAIANLPIYDGDKKTIAEQFSLLCLANEVKITNEIEGVHSTRKQINKIIKEQKSNSRLAPLTLKYNKLLSDIAIPLQTPQDLRDLYDEILSADVLANEKDNALDGKLFRKESVSISDGFKSVHEGINGEDNIIEAVQKMLDILNANEPNELIKIAICHYLLGYIHPFYDGNGRMMRFLSSYGLSKIFKPIVSLNLSYTIQQNKSAYYKAFKPVNDEKNKGDLTPFVISFLEIIAEAVENLQIFIAKKLENYAILQEKLNAKRLPTNEQKICNALLINGIFGAKNADIDELIKLTALSNSTIRNTLKTMDFSWLKVLKESKRFVYCLDFENI